jgi:hypothetical protein
MGRTAALGKLMRSEQNLEGKESGLLTNWAIASN